MSEENLGISDADRQTIINNVNVVIHSAATLDFHESLRPTVNTNLLGTRRVMELCSEIHNLDGVVHVSSAYVNSYLVECEEILYPAPEDAEKVIELARTLNDEELNAKQASLLGEHPNTYTFTKHLAEHEVDKCAARFPCGIVRPSMSKCGFAALPFFSLTICSIHSHWCMEGTDSRMDNFEKWSTRFLDGRIEGCDSSIANRRWAHLRLHSGRCGCQPDLSHRLVRQQEAFKHIEHFPLHIEHIESIQMGRRPGQNQRLFAQISSQIGRLVSNLAPLTVHRTPI